MLTRSRQNKKNRVAQAQRQANLLASFERRALTELAKYFLALRTDAINDPKKFNAAGYNLRGIKRTFTAIQFYTWATSVIEARRNVAKSQLALASEFTVTPDMLAKLQDKDLAAIRDKYGAETERIFARMTTELNDGVRTALKDAVESGLPPRAAVAHYFTSSGLSAGNPYRLQSIVRTQMQLVFNSAAKAEYESEAVRDILWGYEYVTVGDDRVREEHAMLDGTKLPKDDPFWNRFWPPNGWNCRCQAVPIFDEEAPVQPPPTVEPDQGFGFDPSNVEIAQITPKEFVAPVGETTNESLISSMKSAGFQAFNDVAKVDKIVVEMLHSELLTLKEEFPGLETVISSIQTTSLQDGVPFTLRIDGPYKTLYLDDKQLKGRALKSTEKDILRSQKSGWLASKGGTRGVVVHEIAHAIDKAPFALQQQWPGYNAAKKFLRENPPTRADLSGYGVEPGKHQKEEAFAEAFAASKTNPKPSKWQQLFNEALRTGIVPKKS